MREATAAKIHSGPQKGTYGARVVGNPKPRIGDIVKVVRSTGWTTHEKLTRHVWAGKDTKTGTPARVYATVPADSEIAQVTEGEFRQMGIEFQEWGRLLEKGQHRAAGERMIDFGKQVEAGYQEPEDPPEDTSEKGGEGDP